ncbi:Gfo/Idh/MocA family oxidoreductase [Gracilibacillus sp. S3-1-1]|uniref:Gfo/Idh/MocA family oxidoreductase n=1 Tax=Gracilibacillus pellucidus TaxID=3095368 RepID=A0ACC6M108_9BACI|nr:Gfo/Idh/MocA family oxidoreductase [Gracilibacillus sp. S3-1-1]MDX8044581.1 Gfo/Idh/MocA family oxidoreductase [Gracilibacillus sp. S3-1-1]
MTQLKWGVLSTAKIGRTQVIPAIQRSTNGEVMAIASRNEKSAKQTAEELNIPRAYGSYEALLDDPAIDAVYIPLPNALHKEWVIKAAEKKKHVLCEKPVAITNEELVEMITVCEKNNVIFMEAFMYQFHPQHQKVKQFIQDGVIGDIAFMRASFSFYLEDRSNIRLNSDLAGGSMFDVGCYTLHAIRNILDEEPTAAYAHAYYHPKLKVDTTMAGTLTMPSGILASFDSSFDSTSRESYEVVGSKGTITVTSAFRPDTNEGMVGEIFLQTNEGTEVITEAGDQYALMVENFADAILHDQPLFYYTAKMQQQMKVLDAVYESSRTGQVISL